MTQTPYETLGVNDDATPNEIQAAFRAKSKEIHPDLNPDAPESATVAQQALSLAYSILSDSTKRERYDAGLEPDRGNVDLQAMKALADVFQTVLSEALKMIKSADIMSAIKGMLQGRVSDIGKELAASKRVQGSLEEAQERLTKKTKGEDVLGLQIEAGIREHKRRRTALEDERLVMKRALELAADYTYEHEAPVPEEFGVVRVFTSSGGGTVG